MNNPKYIIVHTTDVGRVRSSRQFYVVDRYHKSRGFPKSSLGYYGGYHFFYEPDGTELRYKEDWEIGAHTNEVIDGISMNLQSIALCFAGDGDVEFPTDEQAKAMAKRIKKLVDKYTIPLDNVRIGPHRTWKPTKTCYGSMLGKDWALNLVKPHEKEQEQLNKQIEIEEMKNTLDSLRILLLRLQIFIAKLTRNKSRKKVAPVE